MGVGTGTYGSFPRSWASKLDKGPGKRLKCSGWHGKAPPQSLAGRSPRVDLSKLVLPAMHRGSRLPHAQTLKPPLQPSLKAAQGGGHKTRGKGRQMAGGWEHPRKAGHAQHSLPRPTPEDRPGAPVSGRRPPCVALCFHESLRAREARGALW